ncbi:MAG: hypothetical protein E7171_00265 [Firmicutes bacterium]|nr:hypothetical protein [Bacillota bacterium]
MADVKWIKLNIDMFDDEKIKIIQSMPEGDAMCVIWIKLLTLAGKTNDKGYVYITDDMPYTDEMLAVIFNKPLNTVRLALDTFTKLGMIDVDSKGIYLLNFDRHQSLDKLEKIKEQTRARVQKHREKAKQIALVEDVTLHVTQCNATDIDKDIDKELDKDIEIEKDIEKKEKKKNNIKKEYFSNSKVNDIFLDFIEQRKVLKAVNSDRAINTLVNKLNTYDDNTKYKMIENSILNSWKSIYELKENYNSTRKPIRKEIVPSWFDQEIKKEPMSKEDQEELEELLGEFKDDRKDESWKKEAELLKQQINEAYDK